MKMMATVSGMHFSQYSWSIKRILFNHFQELRSSMVNRSSKTVKINSVCSLTCSALMSKRQMATFSGSESERHYVPRRTLMFVPGHDLKKINKIPSLGVDCAVLECEDGVAINMKEEARKNCKDVLQNGLKLQVKNLDLALRVNSVSSGLIEDDLKAVIGQALGEPLATHLLPQTILVPKVDSIEDLKRFTEILSECKLGRSYVPYFVFFTESAVGLMNLREILEKARDYSSNGHYMLDGVVFGSDDFCADIGAERTLDARELIYARQKVVSLAKAFKLQAIDMVHINIKDLPGLKAGSEEGAKMGYTGKQIIHPSQVGVVNQAFTPSDIRVQWATDLIQGFDQHQKDGQGAFVFKGQMIDMPLLKQAQNVLEIVNKVHKSLD